MIQKKILAPKKKIFVSAGSIFKSLFCLRFMFPIFYTGSFQVPPEIPIWSKLLLHKPEKCPPPPPPTGGGANYVIARITEEGSGEASIAKCYDFPANSLLCLLGMFPWVFIQTQQLYGLMKLNDLDCQVYNWHNKLLKPQVGVSKCKMEQDLLVYSWGYLNAQ